MAPWGLWGQLHYLGLLMTYLILQCHQMELHQGKEWGAWGWQARTFQGQHMGAACLYPAPLLRRPFAVACPT